MNSIIEQLELIAPMSAAFRKAVAKEFISLTLPKNHLLLEAGKIAGRAYYIKGGYAMSYHYVDEIRHIGEFYNKGRIILSPTSFFEQIPSTESIELLEATDVFYITYKSIITLLEKFPIAHTYYQVIMNRYYEQGRERIHDFQYLKASKRYKKFRIHFPRLEKLVPQVYIASYLGIAPQSLSRIKRTINGK